MTNNPTIKLEITPTKKDKSKTKCFISYNAAAATIGVDKRNEYFATDSLSIPKFLPIVIVIPDLETPGKAAANACEIDINTDCFNVISLYFTFAFDFLSTIYNIIPIAISAIAINDDRKKLRDR